MPSILSKTAGDKLRIRSPYRLSHTVFVNSALIIRRKFDVGMTSLSLLPGHRLWERMEDARTHENRLHLMRMIRSITGLWCKNAPSVVNA